MQLRFFTLLIALLFVVLANAAKPGYKDYIMVLKEPVTEDKIATAKADVESDGGEVLSVIRYGLKALIISLPTDSVSTFKHKDYVDFMEQDSEVHITKQ
ncbi:hypothetical protein BX666DRAFT_1926278 [Dichotomocladium elegans]|nr:hypothetical protein BX666DRAFT_1926278 [Dichotomocladium elegans]